MAKKHFIGKATAVKQQATGSIDSHDAATTYKVTIGGVVVSVPGDTDVNTTAANLVTALQASTHPYFQAVAWTNPGAPSNDIQGLATTAGVPFEVSLTVTGGTGTVTDFADDVAATGPNFFDAADNYAGGVAPVSGDEIILENSAVSLLWNIDVTSGNYTLTARKSYTGKIGLRADAFTTSANGETVDTSADEYRETYLKADFRDVRIGEYFGPGSATGSPRIKVNTTSTTAGTTVVVYDTAASASESGKAAVRLKAASANVDVFVRKAPGGVGLGTDAPGETGEVGTLRVLDVTTAAKVHVGEGITVGTFTQSGGTNVVEAAATITTVTADGGNLTLEGDYLVTTLNVNAGATVKANNVPAAGRAITTANVDGTGVLEMTQAGEAQTIGTLSLTGGGTLNGTSLVDVDTAAALDGTVTGDVAFA